MKEVKAYKKGLKEEELFNRESSNSEYVHTINDIISNKLDLWSIIVYLSKEN